jgi:hypothetical protein
MAATRRLRTCLLPGATDGTWMALRSIEILLQAGVGLTEGDAADPPVQGSDPLVSVEVSRDGGQTWGPIRQVAAGKIGAYRRRARVRNLGRYRQGALRVSVSDPVQWAFLRLTANVQQGGR